MKMLEQLLKVGVKIPGRVMWILGLILLQPQEFALNLTNAGLWAMTSIGLVLEAVYYLREEKKAKAK